MRAADERTLPCPPARVLEVLGDHEALTWLPGVRDVEVIATRGATSEVVVRVWALRTLPLRLEIEAKEDGLDATLVEGPVAHCAARVRVRAHEAGAVARWELELELRAHVPGPLATELSARLLPRWLEALEHACRPPAPAAPGGTAPRGG